MRYRDTPKRTSPLTIALATLLGALAFSAGVIIHMEQQRVRLMRADTAVLAKECANTIASAIDRALSATHALAALVQQGQGRVADFQEIGKAMLPHYPGVNALFLAPDGVIRDGVPLAGNEPVIGLDLLNDPARAPDARLALETGHLTLSSPYRLVQGQIGIIGRLPVFIDDAQGNPAFWGFTIARLPFPDALAPSHLSLLGERGIAYRLWTTHPATGDIQIIEASSVEPVSPVEAQLQMPNAIWTLSLSPVDGWGDPLGLGVRAGLGLLFSVLLATLATLLADARTQKARLAMKVAERTAEVRAREADLKCAEGIAQVGSWDFDIPSNRATASAVASRIIGLQPNTFFSLEQLLEQVYPLDRTPVETAWQAALRGAPYDIELRTLVDDKVRWLRQRAVLEFDPSGKPLRALGSVEDITERKLVQDALRRSEARLREIIDTAREGIWTVDIEGRTTFANPRMAELLGYRIEQRVGRSFFDFLDPDTRGSVEQSLAKYRAGIAETYERRFRRLDGSYLWALVSSNPLYGEDGEVSGALTMITDISARKEDEAAIRRLAFYDPLTGLANRRLLLDRLNQALAAAARTGRHGALIFIDLDNFKQLNDTRGHQTGDLLLEEVAQRLNETVRKSDSVARLGGDEFVVLLQDLGDDPAQAAALAKGVGEKIIAVLGRPYMLGGEEHNSTPSLGIAMFSQGPHTVEGVLKHADLAMYQAKAAGRNRLRFYDPEMQASVNQRASLERELRHAIGDGQLVLHYQPQVDVQGRVNGAEALLRWRHPERGLIPPAQFIGLAESLGLAFALGRWVLASACAQLAEWARRPESEKLNLAVNISGAHFRRPEFVEDIRRALAESGANPERLRLELAEASLLDAPDDSRVKMIALKAMGIGFTLDNFGSGYCSLSYLKRLPLDQLKIAPVFVREVLEHSDDATADSFIALAESLGLAIMAEGVETEAQRDYLVHHGCRAFQGFLFGLPGPAEALLAGGAHPEPQGR